MSTDQSTDEEKAHGTQAARTLPHLFHSATDGSPVPLLATEGPRHIVVYANPAYRRLSRHTHEQLIGHPLAESMHESERDGYFALMDRVYRTGQAEALSDQQHSAPDSSTAYWSYTAWAVPDESKRTVGVMLQVTDTTEAALYRHRSTSLNGQLLVSVLRQHEMAESSDKLNALLEVYATTDGLTGLKNHRTFHDRLRAEVERTLRHNSPLSVLFLDIDNFKQYNDDYGHLAGDAVLRRIGEILSGIARETDMVARYGGEEFSAILTGTDAEGAKVLAERYRHAIETGPWSERPVTVSIGTNTFSRSARDSISLLAGADRALYLSKHRGRNCVTSAIDAVAPPEAEILPPIESMMDEMLDWHDVALIGAPGPVKESLNQLMIESWSRLIGLRDTETRNHSERVTEMMALFARTMGMNEEHVRLARWGAALHDIGKIGVPDSILQKPGPLTDDEWVVMKEHASLAYEMLSPFPFLVGPTLDIARCHHERWAGNGYPLGSRGEDIPLAARMFAIVDVYDALRSDRPYRTAWSEEKIRAFIRTQSGTQFEPRLVDIFLKMLPSQDETNSTAFEEE